MIFTTFSFLQVILQDQNEDDAGQILLAIVGTFLFFGVFIIYQYLKYRKDFNNPTLRL